MATEPNTPADPAPEITADLKTIQPLQTEDVPLEPIPEAPAAPAAPAAEDGKDRTDPRADRMEEIAKRRRETVATELEQIAEAVIPAPSAEPAPITPEPASEITIGDPNRKVRLKIRGELVEMTETEALALAQKTAAADSYLTEARTTLDEVKELRRQAGTTPAPAPAAATEKEEPIDRLALYTEAIQNGADPAEARKLLDAELDERVDRRIDQRTAQQSQAQVEQGFDDDVRAGLTRFGTDYPDVAKDDVAADVIISMSRRLEGAVISRYLVEGADDRIRSAFAASGITPEAVARYTPEEQHMLYRDMHLKGYPLPKPAAIIVAAGKVVAERWATTTRAPAPVTAPVTPAPQPVAVDRTGRKMAIQQPERTAVPRTPTAQPAPRTEAERAAAAREEARVNRRGGVARG